MKAQNTFLASISFVIIFAMPLFVHAAEQNSCSTDHVLYGTPGSYSFTVPDGVTSLRVVTVGAGGAGGAGGNGSQQCKVAGFPWCGKFYPASNGASGGASSIGTISAAGGGWGRTGFYNLYNNHSGGI